MIFNCKITGIGTCLPPIILSNEDLVTEENGRWIEENLGIRERREAYGMSVVEMGVSAANRAINDALINKEDIDLVIVSCSSPDYFAPNISSQIIKALGIQTKALDINVVCTGFLYALEMACIYCESSVTRNVLIVATEKYSSITDYSSRDCVYFGDGAGAVIVKYSSHGTIAIQLTADGLSDDAFIAQPGKTFTMQGHKVYQKALEVLPGAINKILDDLSFSIKDVDYLVPHQAGIRVLRDMCTAVNLPFEKCITVMDKYANIASASIPIALNEIDLTNKTVLLAAIGSGWSWGTAIIRQ